MSKQRTPPIRSPQPRAHRTLSAFLVATLSVLVTPAQLAHAVIAETPAAAVLPEGAPPATGTTTPVRPSGTARTEARIVSMHARLKITGEQEPAWRKVADVMREDAQTIDHLMEARKAVTGQQTAPEILRSYSAMTTAHAHGVTLLADAFDGLYTQLSASQKQAADEMFRHKGQGGMMSGSARKHAS